MLRKPLIKNSLTTTHVYIMKIAIVNRLKTRLFYFYCVVYVNFKKQDVINTTLTIANFQLILPPAPQVNK